MRKAMSAILAILCAALLLAVGGLAYVLGWAVARLLSAVGL